MIWLITGASRGFGLEIARQALARGDSVAATARDPQRIEAALPEGGDRLLALALDVTDEAEARAAVAIAVERFGGIDVLVNNAGRGLLGAVEEASAAEVEAVFATNVFGLLAVTRSVLPVMRAQKSGRVVNMSSVGGFVQFPGWGIYGATKFAVEGLSEALRDELEPLGISVTVIEPGRFRTDFLDGSSLRESEKTILDYAGTAGAVRRDSHERNHLQPGDPVRAATAIVTVATAPDPPLRLQLGADCVAQVEDKLRRVAEELAQWRELSLSTALDESAAVGASQP